jgi:hypothetical protein
MKIRIRKIWGGFDDGRLAKMCVDDFFGGANERPALALFTSLKEASRQYQDVRAVQLKYLENTRSKIK